MGTNRRIRASLAATAAVFATSVAFAQSAPTSPDPYAGSGSGLSTGGLAPPGSGTGVPSGYDPGHSPSTEQSLKQADEKDSGRGLQFVWVNAEAGFQYLSLNTFHANNLVDAKFVKSTQSGLLLGAAAGVRLIFLTLGARFRWGDFAAWQMWTLDAEAGLHLPIGIVEPYFNFALGYASLGAYGGEANSINFQNAGASIHGVNARGGVGLDIYLNRFLSIGALLTGDILYLKRSQHLTIAGADTDPAKAEAQRVYANDGSSVGGAATLTGVVGLHF